jgi:hypothetical protein
VATLRHEAISRGDRAFVVVVSLVSVYSKVTAPEKEVSSNTILSSGCIFFCGSTIGLSTPKK